MANAAAAVQQDDDPEPADAEPWVLEGWGDGPSVSEAAQQAALRLGPYHKNVPTTLVGLGVAGGGRRVLSAGHRAPLKVSEARRKPGSGPVGTQADRRASGPAGTGHTATATVRRMPPPRNLDVGDESDVEPTPPSSSATAAATLHNQQVGQQAAARPLPGGQRRAPSPMRHAATTTTGQQPAQAAGPGSGTRLGRREPGAAASSGAASAGAQAAGAHPWAPGAADAASYASPRHPRSISAEAYHPSGPPGGASGAATRPGQTGGAGRTGGGAAAAGSGTSLPPATGSPAHAHPPLPPGSSAHQPLSGHLEPLNPHSGRGGAGRMVSGPSDSGAASADRSGGSDLQPPPRSSSFSSLANPNGALIGEGSDSHLGPGSSHPGGHPPAAGGGGAGGGGTHHTPPALPGLFPTGRRPSSLRAEGGLSGWDPDAPPVQAPQSPAQAGSNVSLWIGPTAPGAGTSGLQVGPAGAGRGAGGASPGQGPHRRDQLAGNSRLQRGAVGPAVGILDMSLGPDRSSQHGGGPPPAAAVAAGGPGVRGAVRPQAAPAQLHYGQGSSRSGSPDVKGVGCPPSFPLPQKDALTEFCASRAELGSAGAAGGVGLGPGGGPAEARGQGGSSMSGMMAAPLPVTVAIRATSLSKMPAAVARVS